MEKKIGDTYTADPFESVQVGRWLLRAILPCKITTPDEPFHLNDDDSVPYIRFEIHPAHPAFSATNSAGYNKRLHGWMIILDEPDLCDEDNIRQIIGSPKRNEGHLHYLLAHSLSPEMQSLLKNNGINSFQMHELTEIAGGKQSSLNIPMKRDHVGGILTVLEQERIKEYAEHRDGFVYYLLGGIGGAVPTHHGSGCLLATYCPSWPDCEGGVVAIADIDEITESTFDEASKLYEGIPKALTDEDLAYYRLRRDKDRLHVLKCSRLRLLPQPIEMRNPIWTTEMREYISQQVEHTNSAYINRDICEGIRKTVEPSNPVPDNSTGFAARETWAGSEHKAPELPVINRKGMKILFLAASPLEWPMLDLEAEENALREVIESTKYRESIEVVTRLGIQPDKLVPYVREHQPNIIHFSGHGTTGGLIVRNDRGKFQAVSGEDLSQFLEDRGVDLVVLNACYSQPHADAICSAVKAVVGTTQAVTDEAARKFTVAFYRSLGNGLPVEQASRDARDTLRLLRLEYVFQNRGDLSYTFFPERSKGAGH
ncbi:MAG TPA: CHAT domain-containing protein [Candidatus Angelobacter sp.]|nr:CHAT domain-containing protein [Candidatus Angelobacter sp.]